MKHKWYGLLGGALIAALPGSCQSQPFGETLQAFLQDFARQIIAAAVT